MRGVTDNEIVGTARGFTVGRHGQSRLPASSRRHRWAGLKPAPTVASPTDEIADTFAVSPLGLHGQSRLPTPFAASPLGVADNRDCRRRSRRHRWESRTIETSCAAQDVTVGAGFQPAPTVASRTKEIATTVRGFAVGASRTNPPSPQSPSPDAERLAASSISTANSR
jgi:hypothetical protein